MKKYNLLIAILFLSLIFTNVVFGQASMTWVRTYNGAFNGDDVATAMAVDGSGNVYVSGYIYCWFGNDYATIKYNSNGDVVWVRTYDAGGADDRATALAVDGSGNVYVTGSAQNAMYVGYATIKYNSNGDVVWVRTYYSGGVYLYAEPSALAVDNAGNVYVTGRGYNGTNFDYATLKYNSNGDEIWARTYNGAGNAEDKATALAVDNLGNVYVTGYSVCGSTGYDYATIKYNSNGDVVWSRIYNGAGNGNDKPSAITVDNLGNVYVAGDNGEGTSNTDYTIIKYNSNGDAVWVRTYNGAGNAEDIATALAVDNLGNVYVTGHSYISGYDYATIKWNSNGDFIWLRTFDYEGSPDYAVALKLDNLGNVFVAGHSYFWGSYNYTTVKYKSNGTQLWHISYNGNGNGDDYPTALALDNSGNFYVTGISSNGSNYDYATIKYTQTPYYITSSAIGDGTISPSGIITMYWGLDTTFTITPNLGYHIDSVVVDGVNQGAISNYTFFAIINHHTIIAYFGINTYTITATAIGNGTISPSGTVIVNYGSDTTFYIAPNPGYHLDSLIMDGINHGADSTSFRFEDISDNHAIDAYFSINYYNLTVNIIGNGSVVKNPDTLAYAYDAWVSLTANAGKAGWHFMAWSDSLTGSNNPDSILINSDKVVTATFAIDTFTINATATSGGTILPSGIITMIYGDDTTFIITPDIGHHLDSLIVDGTNHGSDSTSFRFEDISANHTIGAYFSIDQHTLSINIIGNGTVSKDPDEPVYDYGTIVELTAYPDPNWGFIGWSGDTISTDNPILVTMDKDKDITATFTFIETPGWTQKESIPEASDIKPGKYVKDGASMTMINVSDAGDVIYAFPGQKSLMFYKYSEGVWTTTLAPIPYGYKSKDLEKINKKKVSKGSALLWDGDNIIYATKGNTDEFWAYYIDTDSWVQKAFVPVNKKYKGGTSMALYDSKVYLLAGGQKPGVENNFFVYDPTADTLPLAPLSDAWFSLTSAPGGINNKKWKDGSCLALIGDIIYALKGGDKYNQMWTYDLIGTVWTEAESIPIYNTQLDKKTKTKDGGAMTTDGTVLYAIKGGGKQDFWMYTPGAPGTWTELEIIPKLHNKSVPKTGAALAWANNRVWLIKGNKTPEFWQYVPQSMSKLKNQKAKVISNIQTEETLKQVQGDMILSATPNPIKRNTQIRYSVLVAGKISIKLYNSSGRLVENLLDNIMIAGNYTLNLNATKLAKGVYFLKYEANHEKSEIKLIVQ
jgi:uncharacterized delta-60 repeat protein